MILLLWVVLLALLANTAIVWGLGWEVYQLRKSVYVLTKEVVQTMSLADDIDAKFIELDGKVDREDADIEALRAQIANAPAGTPDSKLQEWSDKLAALEAKIDHEEPPTA